MGEWPGLSLEVGTTEMLVTLVMLPKQWMVDRHIQG